MLELVAKDSGSINEDKLKNKFLVSSQLLGFSQVPSVLPMFFYLSVLKYSIKKKLIHLKQPFTEKNVL